MCLTDGIQRKTEADRSMRPARDIVAQVFSRFTQPWKEEEKAALEIYENGEKVDQSYLMSNEDAVDKIVKDAKDSNEFYAKLNEIQSRTYL